MQKIPGGYYIKARQIKDSWIAHAAPVVREVWDYLLREANHNDKKYNGFVISRGQLFRSYRDIRDDLSWMVGARKVRYSENQMKHTMKLLRINLMITLSSQPRGNLITILNYDKFQNPKNYESTSEQSGESTSDQPRINQSSTAINKNDKELNNILPYGNTSKLKVSTPVCPHEKIRVLYNEILPELPTCTVRNKTFDQNTRARWNEDKKRQNLDWWESLFKSIRKSDFLMGRSKTNFRASLDWIVLPTNMTKILNGNYENRKEGSSWKV
jgi:hypothetical protein